MSKGFEFSELETRLQMTLDALSNGESVEVKDEWIVQAGKAFEDALRKHVTESRTDFRLRVSNLGKPTCQLQHEKMGTKGQRRPYNHIVRMLIGDAVEQIIELAIKASGVNITGGKTKVKFNINGNTIAGEDDIEIDNEVWDIKSSSPYMFQHKWQDGWEGIYRSDTFGYVEQLFGYATALNMPMGGWVVVDKSSGEIKVVKANPSATQLKDIEQRISSTERTISTDAPFAKCFEEEDEFFRKKPTGNKVLPTVCTFCSFMGTCWPTAKLMPQAMSQAQEPKPTWYTKYDEETNRKPRLAPTIPIDNRDPFFGVTKRRE